MIKEWKELARIADEDPIIIERARIEGRGISVEGEFEPPPLARLTPEDQVFVALFVRSHGSIKEMEQLFGVSYPTIKNRLNRIADQLEVARIETVESKSEILGELERGDINVEEAIRKLKR